MNVGEAVARTLVDEGVDAVFSLLGDGTARIVYHMAQLGVPVYEGRHEAYVYAMADGYGRTKGTPAVCAITGGPAVGHTFTAMTAAARSRSPVILLTGPSSRDALVGRQRLDHRAMTELTGARFFPIHDPGNAERRTRQSVDWVRAGGGPAVLDVSEVTQGADFEGTLEPRSGLRPPGPGRIHPDPESIEAASRLIASAGRPVILAGAGAVMSGARDELVALGEDLGALLTTTIEARGMFFGDPFNAGVSGGFASEPAAALLPEADLVISFGTTLDRFVTRDGALYPGAAHIRVDVQPPGDRSAACYIQGDALVVAQALRAAIPARPARSGYRTDTTARRLTDPVDPHRAETEPERVDPREVCALLDELLPPGCGWVTGNSGHFWAFPIMHMPRPRRPLLHASAFGAIGYGIPVGLGAALAHGGEPVVVFEGDGGAMMHIQAIETAARYRARMLVVVLSDGALGAEYHNMVAEGYDPDLSLLPDVDLAGVARQFGCRAGTLTAVDQLGAMVSEFLSGSGPMLIDARVSRRVISAPVRRAVYGIDGWSGRSG